ncbi:stress protein [Thiocystis minor]|uniref:TerD family protein n=1 Tax=Thiocystis minor TaxID=61597 RepID=UPI00191267EF|nr:TerD family protein [Thiocystis minor]MBK5962951.1 stress protein [Thiocystis minor]
MSLVLSKGANAPIARLAVLIGIGWEASDAWEIDASAFLVGANGRVRGDHDFIFYNQTKTPCGSLQLDSNPPTDQRHFQAMLENVPEDVAKIIFIITIGSDVDANGCPHCGMLGGIYIRVATTGDGKGDDKEGDDELLRFDPSDIGRERALMLGELYRYQGNWKFRAIGQGYNGGLDALATELGVDVQQDDSSADDDDYAADPTAISSATPANKPVVALKRRRTSREIWEDRLVAFHRALCNFLPQIEAAVVNQSNESNTRMILDRMLLDVFGYSMEEVKAEQKVQGRKADYVLALGDQNVIIGEVKRAGLPLRDKHIFQATSYGAYSGIRWALLTNLSTWQLYHISAQDVVEAKLVFSVDLLPSLSQEDCERLMLISRYGMFRKGLLEKHWNSVNALTRESLIRAILTEDVVTRIRRVIRRDTGCNFSDDQIQQALDDLLIHA